MNTAMTETRSTEDAADDVKTASQHSLPVANTKSAQMCRQVAVLYCDRPTSLKFSGTGRLVATGSTDGDIRIWTQFHWNRSSGCNRSPEHSNGSLPFKNINTTPCRPTDRRELSKPGNARSNSLETAAVADKRLRGHILGVNDVAWTPEDRYLISASDDKMLRLWDVETGALLKNFKGHRQSVYCCTINPQGNIILSGSSDYSYRLWDLRTGSCFQRFEAHRDTVTSVDFTRVDGSCFMTASYDGACRIYDLLLGKCLRSVMHPFGEQNPPVGSARFSPNGRYLLASYLNSTIKVWDFTNLKASNVRTFTGHVNEKFSVPSAFVSSPSINNIPVAKNMTPVSAKHPQYGKTSRSSDAADFSPIMTSNQCCNQPRKTQWVVSGTEDGHMVWWNVQSRALVCRTRCYSDDDYKNIVAPSNGRVSSSRQTPSKPNSQIDNAPANGLSGCVAGFRSLADIADTPSFNFNNMCNADFGRFVPAHLVDHIRRRASPTHGATASSQGSFNPMPNQHTELLTDYYRNNSSNTDAHDAAETTAAKVVVGLSAHPRAPFVATSLRQNPYVRIWRFNPNFASS